MNTPWAQRGTRAVELAAWNPLCKHVVNGAIRGASGGECLLNREAPALRSPTFWKLSWTKRGEMGGSFAITRREDRKLMPGLEFRPDVHRYCGMRRDAINAFVHPNTGCVAKICKVIIDLVLRGNSNIVLLSTR